MNTTAYAFTAEGAQDLIKTALASGTIKLQGPVATVKGSIETGSADAAYLLTLMNQLVTRQPSDDRA